MEQYIRYFIPEDGDDVEHPNVFSLPANAQPTLVSIQKNFPLPGKYQFRFAKKLGDRFVWLDVSDGSAPVPSLNGSVLLKVSRISMGHVEAPKPQTDSSRSSETPGNIRMDSVNASNHHSQTSSHASESDLLNLDSTVHEAPHSAPTSPPPDPLAFLSSSTPLQATVTSSPPQHHPQPQRPQHHMQQQQQQQAQARHQQSNSMGISNMMGTGGMPRGMAYDAFSGLGDTSQQSGGRMPSPAPQFGYPQQSRTNQKPGTWK